MRPFDEDYDSIQYEPLQILAAEPGWRAVFKQPDATFTTEPIVMWAVCLVTLTQRPREAEEYRKVVGMVSTGTELEPAEDFSDFGDFRGYVEPGKDVDASWGMP